MIKHSMNLRQEPFEKIRDGKKIIESRLYDEKRQGIMLGDQLEFSCVETSEKVNTEVIGLIRYATFAKMFMDISPQMFGGDSREFLTNEINQFYSTEEQERYGVLGIRLQLLK